MIKKKLTIYVDPEYANWISYFPAANTASGSVTAITEWSIRQLKRGMAIALRKLDDKERIIIVKYASTLIIVPECSSETFLVSLEDWILYNESDWSIEDIKKLLEKCREFTPFEILGLLCWAKGFWQLKNADINEYINLSARA